MWWLNAVNKVWSVIAPFVINPAFESHLIARF